MLSSLLLTNTLHNILSKPLAAFQHNHRQNNGQRWERNESCRNYYHQPLERILAKPKVQNSDLLFSSLLGYRLTNRGSAVWWRVQLVVFILRAECDTILSRIVSHSALDMLSLSLDKSDIFLFTLSAFSTVFFKDLYCRHVKTRACLGKG